MDTSIVIFAAIGFLAQLVDGALGMAFGAPPALASAAIHAAEMVTTGVSGLSHLWHRNVDRALFWRLMGAGVAGGALGAYVLIGLPDNVIRPIVALYLL